MPKITEIYYIS